MKKRPINLDLTTLKFPVPSIVSILHRISGLVLFLFIPVLLMLLGRSLKSAEQFDQVAQWFSSFPAKLVLLGFLAALVYHLFAGLRHLIMDFGVGETLQSSRRSSYAVLVLAIIVTIGLGIRLW